MKYCCINVQNIKKRVIQLEVYIFPIKYPGIDRAVKADLKVLKSFRPIFQRIYKNHNVAGITEFYTTTVLNECDFLAEAKTLELMQKLFQKQTDIIIPKLHKEFTTKNVVTTEYIEAQSLYEFLKEASPEKKQRVIEKLKRYYYFLLDKADLIQLDPHFGNFLVTDDKLVCIDFGGYIHMNTKSSRVFRDMVKHSKAEDSLAMYKLLGKEGIIDGKKISLANFERYLAPAYFRPFEVNKYGVQNIFQSYKDQLEEPLRSGVIDNSPDIPFYWFTYLIFLSLFSRIENENI